MAKLSLKFIETFIVIFNNFQKLTPRRRWPPYSARTPSWGVLSSSPMGSPSRMWSSGRSRASRFPSIYGKNLFDNDTTARLHATDKFINHTKMSNMILLCEKIRYKTFSQELWLCYILVGQSAWSVTVKLMLEFVLSGMTDTRRIRAKDMRIESPSPGRRVSIWRMSTRMTRAGTAVWFTFSTVAPTHRRTARGSSWTFTVRAIRL